MSDFGCSCCWPPSAEDAWAAKRGSSIERFLIDQPHYIVSIWHCPTCSQRFLSVTTETIDWEAGEDPVHRTFMPITAPEAAELASAGEPTDETLNAIGPGRRSLRCDHPKGSRPRVYWSTGILVGLHD